MTKRSQGCQWIKVANQMTLKQGDFPGLLGWIQYNDKGLKMWKEVEKSVSEEQEKDLTGLWWKILFRDISLQAGAGQEQTRLPQTPL